jgi:hypothetical protein
MDGARVMGLYTTLGALHCERRFRDIEPFECAQHECFALAGRQLLERLP